MINWVVKALHKQVCVCFYCLPTLSQARKVIFDSITNDGVKFLDYFPKELVDQINKSEMKITFKNGSHIQLVGSDNYDSLVGTNPKVIIFSEYAVADPKAWDYLRPILAVNGGTAVFISTPRGKNHFWDLYCHAQTNDKWFCEKLTNDNTHVLSNEQLEEERKSGMSEEMIQQEYFTSFDRGVEGSYYGRILQKARVDKRIGRVAYEPRSQVFTAWDIGYGDSTAIVFWQTIGTELRIIDYYENSGESIAHYVKIVKEKPYIYGEHYLPHDAGAGSIQTGRSVQQMASELGLKSVILPRDDISVGIEATRALLEVAYIDDTKCARLIKCLENYCKRYNDKLNVYSDTPRHDWSSHGSDATRYAAMARIHYAKGAGSLNAEKIKEMRIRNLGY
jgi:hypothetical protein